MGQVIFKEQPLMDLNKDSLTQNRLHITYLGVDIEAKNPISRGNNSVNGANTERDSLEFSTISKFQLPIENDSINKLVDSLFILITEDSLNLLERRLQALKPQTALNARGLLSDIPSILPFRIRSWSEYRISSGFGIRWHPIREKLHAHSGVDFPLRANTLVYATADGVVDKLVWQPSGIGLALYLKHRSGYTTVYGHLEKNLVFVGQGVRRGEVIGLSGNTGLSTAPHLHYSVLDGNVPVNPVNFCFLLLKAIDQIR